MNYLQTLLLMFWAVRISTFKLILSISMQGPKFYLAYIISKLIFDSYLTSYDSTFQKTMRTSILNRLHKASRDMTTLE